MLQPWTTTTVVYTSALQYSGPVLPFGRKFSFLRKFQPSEGNQKEIEFRRKKKEIRVKYKEY